MRNLHLQVNAPYKIATISSKWHSSASTRQSFLDTQLCSESLIVWALPRTQREAVIGGIESYGAPQTALCPHYMLPGNFSKKCKWAMILRRIRCTTGCRLRFSLKIRCATVTLQNTKMSPKYGRLGPSSLEQQPQWSFLIRIVPWERPVWLRLRLSIR